MPAIITNKFRIHNQEQFVESFTEASPNVYYMGIGRPQAWATSTRGDSRTQYEGTDGTPLTPVDSVSQEFHTFDDILAAKKLQVQMFRLLFQEEIGLQEQYMIITDTIMVIM